MNESKEEQTKIRITMVITHPQVDPQEDDLSVVKTIIDKNPYFEQHIAEAIGRSLDLGFCCGVDNFEFETLPL